MTAEFLTQFHVENFRRAKRAAIAQKNDAFPVPCVVFVDSGRYMGFGIVWCENDDEFPIELNVRLENGNSWHYPIEDCTKINDRRQWPGWIMDEFQEYSNRIGK